MNQLSISTDLAARERERSLVGARRRRSVAPRRPRSIGLRRGRLLIAIDGRGGSVEPFGFRGSW
jgi:hypothetical protein